MNRSRLCISAITAILLVCTGAVPGSAGDTPATTVVRKLYAWYFSPHPQPANFWGDDLAGARPYLDPGLYSLLRDTLAYQTQHKEVILDFDPFVAAQIRASSAAVGTSASRGSRTAVPVILTYPKAARASVTAIVMQAGGSARVYDILGKDYALRSLLAANLKQARAVVAPATRP